MVLPSQLTNHHQSHTMMGGALYKHKLWINVIFQYQKISKGIKCWYWIFPCCLLEKRLKWIETFKICSNSSEDTSTYINLLSSQRHIVLNSKFTRPVNGTDLKTELIMGCTDKGHKVKDCVCTRVRVHACMCVKGSMFLTPIISTFLWGLLEND